MAAVAEKEPAMVFAVSGGDVATPDELVVALVEGPPPLNVASAPLEPDANVKVTGAPCTGWPAESVTFAVSALALTPVALAVTGQPLVLISWTWSGDWKLAPVLAVWGVPPVAVIALG
jgi:hypothetical protein